MKLSKFKQHLGAVSQINFVQPNGAFVPAHFHITEAGLTTKHFIDCGGTVRTEKTIGFQVWVAEDLWHRLEPQKLNKIINISEKLFDNQDLEIEVEYQTDTIGRYGLHFNGKDFVLVPKQTACLAVESCGVSKQKLPLNELKTQTACCTPGGGCC